MKTLIVATTLMLTCFIAQAQQPETYYILVPQGELSQQMIGQLKNFSSDNAGKFMQDDTTTLREITFQQDTSQVYVILSWEGAQPPTSVPNGYELNNANIEERIFTETEMVNYINENQHMDGLLIEEQLLMDE